jgi:uncharacterized protein (TIGR03643 family)
MPKKSKHPETRVKNPEPDQGTDSWVIWAAWADRVTFEEIFERTGLTEAQVIQQMRRTLKASSFRRWRRRVHEGVSIKHRRKFVTRRAREQRWGEEGELPSSDAP